VEPAIRGVVLLSTLLPVTADSQEELFHYHCTWRVLNRFSLSYFFYLGLYYQQFIWHRKQKVKQNAL